SPLGAIGSSQSGMVVEATLLICSPFRSLNVENLFQSVRTLDGNRGCVAEKSSPRSSKSRGYHQGVSIPRHDGHGQKSSQTHPKTRPNSSNPRETALDCETPGIPRPEYDQNSARQTPLGRDNWPN